jgi:hypothetical protein
MILRARALVSKRKQFERTNSKSLSFRTHFSSQRTTCFYRKCSAFRQPAMRNTALSEIKSDGHPNSSATLNLFAAKNNTCDKPLLLGLASLAFSCVLCEMNGCRGAERVVLRFRVAKIKLILLQKFSIEHERRPFAYTIVFVVSERCSDRCNEVRRFRLSFNPFPWADGLRGTCPILYRPGPAAAVFGSTVGS